MADNSIYLRAFALVAQPVIVIKNDCIEYMNPAAVKLANRELTGSHVSRLFPSHVVNIQAESFVTTAFIGTKSCVVNVSSKGKSKICVLSPKDSPAPDNSMIFARLRSSLSNIRFASGCIAICGENNNDERLLGYVSSLNRSYNSIKRTIDNMSTLGMLDRGELPFSPEPFDVTAACAAIIDTLKFSLKRDGLEISLHAEDRIRIVADRRLFEQLLMNLLANSIEHCDENGRINVSLLRTDKHLVLGVNDDGGGISADMMPGIFQRYRENQGLSSADCGSGMGLAIVRGIAELHDGAVIIESRGEGKGTSVRVMFSCEIASGSQFSDASPEDNSQLFQTVLTEFSHILPDSCYSNLSDD
ncbi:MAG: HAMP domain-containing sensor histidine kinase [Bacillota bacterium]|nr:HAMP domain-containing sensor histidine kinase [Bacillota bacterium]